MIEKRYSSVEESFFKNLCFPEEEKHRFTCMPWDGSFRYFRAENVTCLEYYRRVPAGQAPRVKPAA